MKRKFLRKNRATNLDLSRDQIAYDFLQAHATRSGYLRSRIEGRPISLDRKPMPWFTYPAIEFLSQIDKKGISVFEFGTGNSTLYWDKSGANVFGVEHDAVWFQSVVKDSSNSLSIDLFENKEDYTNSILKHDLNFDVVVIDGIWRNECALTAIQKLSSGGVIILDNSDWYVDVVEFLDSQKFVRVDFNGPGPINNYSWTTSFFFRGDCVFSNRLSAPMPIMGIGVTSRPENW